MCSPSLMYLNSLFSSMFLTSEGAVALFRHDEKGELKYCGSMLGNTVFSISVACYRQALLN